jgi:hypothetical protein
MKTELENTREALDTAVNALISISQGNCPAGLRTKCYDALEKVTTIRNPPPEIEEVTLTRWETTGPSGCPEWSTFGADAADWERKGQIVIELTGTYKRPKPRKVEKSIIIKSVFVDLRGQLTCQPIFRQGPEGKTGTLTFSWTE